MVGNHSVLFHHRVVFRQDHDTILSICVKTMMLHMYRELCDKFSIHHARVTGVTKEIRSTVVRMLRACFDSGLQQTYSMQMVKVDKTLKGMFGLHPSLVPTPR